MKAPKGRPDRVLKCPACQTLVCAPVTLYKACESCPPLRCKHGGVALAIWRIYCPGPVKGDGCGALIEDVEHIHGQQVELGRIEW